MIRTAVIAFGFSAQTFHLPFLMASKHFQVTHIVTSKAELVAADFPKVTALSDIDGLTSNDVDLAIITTPNHLHFPQAKALLEKGIHVVVEKPFVLSSAEAVELQQVADSAKRVLTVFQNRRWDGDFLTVTALVEQGRVGELKRMTTRFDRFRPQVRQRWREQPGAGAGIFWDLAPHLLDQAVSLFGLPSQVNARIRAMRNGSEVEDAFELVLDYGSFEVCAGSSPFQAGPTARFQLEGTEGTFVKYGLDPQENALKAGVDVTDERWGQEPEEDWGVLYQEGSNRVVPTKPGNYDAFWHQLAQAITDEQEAPVPIAEAIDVLRLMEAALKANETGTWVNLSA